MQIIIIKSLLLYSTPTYAKKKAFKGRKKKEIPEAKKDQPAIVVSCSARTYVSSEQRRAHTNKAKQKQAANTLLTLCYLHGPPHPTTLLATVRARSALRLDFPHMFLVHPFNSSGSLKKKEEEKSRAELFWKPRPL